MKNITLMFLLFVLSLSISYAKTFEIENFDMQKGTSEIMKSDIDILAIQEKFDLSIMDIDSVLDNRKTMEGDFIKDLKEKSLYDKKSPVRIIIILMDDIVSINVCEVFDNCMISYYTREVQAKNKDEKVKKISQIYEDFLKNYYERIKLYKGEEK